MKDVMHNYDVFPKVFPKDKEIEITVKPLGAHAAFEREQYSIVICPLSQGTPRDYPNMTGFENLTVKPDADGCIRFKYTFKGEQEHYIRFLKENGDRDFQLSVYSLICSETNLTCCGIQLVQSLEYSALTVSNPVI